MLDISIVSHGHGEMVSKLVSQVSRFPEVRRVIVTLNVPEVIAFGDQSKLLVLSNSEPKGFGANHNQAFQQSISDYFCVLNPDISITENIFPRLLSCLDEKICDIAAPLIFSPDGAEEDSARKFPTLRSIVGKVFSYKGVFPHGDSTEVFYPDWIGGMFMLFDTATFCRLGGFDERYFLYYEDVDICFRARRLGAEIAVCQDVGVVHDARRASRRNLRHFGWHVQSFARYWLKSIGSKSRG